MPILQLLTKTVLSRLLSGVIKTQLARNLLPEVALLNDVLAFLKKYKVQPEHLEEWEALFRNLPSLHGDPQLGAEDHYFDLAMGRWVRFKTKFQIEGMVGVTHYMECYLFELSRKVLNPEMTDQFSGQERLKQVEMIIKFCMLYWGKPRAFAALSIEEIEAQFRGLVHESIPV